MKRSRRTTKSKSTVIERAIKKAREHQEAVIRSLSITQAQLQRLSMSEDVWLDESDALHVVNVPDVKDGTRDRSWCSNDFYWLGYARVGDVWSIAVKIDRGTWIREGGQWAYFLMSQIAVKPVLDCDREIRAAAERSLPDLFSKLEQKHGVTIPTAVHFVRRPDKGSA